MVPMNADDLFFFFFILPGRRGIVAPRIKWWDDATPMNGGLVSERVCAYVILGGK